MHAPSPLRPKPQERDGHWRRKRKGGEGIGVGDWRFLGRDLSPPPPLLFPRISPSHLLSHHASPSSSPFYYSRNRDAPIATKKKRKSLFLETTMLGNKQTRLRWKFWTLTFLYGAVLRWHQRSRPSFAVISSTEMS